MSATRNIAWLPSALCGDIARELDAMLSAWVADWGLPAAGQAKCERLAADTAPAGAHVDLLASSPAELKRAIAQALFKFDPVGSPLVDDVVRRVLEALTRRLAEAFASASAEDSGQVPVGDRGVQVTVELLGLRCGFMLSCKQLRACGRLVIPAARAIPAIDLEQALAETPLPLVAELGRAEINLDDLMQLAPGDVLVLKETLDAPLRVILPGSALELSGHLGAFSNPPQRAVRWLAS